MVHTQTAQNIKNLSEDLISFQNCEPGRTISNVSGCSYCTQCTVYNCTLGWADLHKRSKGEKYGRYLCQN